MTGALITGASGFIGFHVAKELIARGVKVAAMVREGEEGRFARLLPRAEVVPCELKDVRRLPELLSGKYEVLYHFAWQGVSGPGQGDWRAQLENLEAARALGETLPRLGVRRLIGAGSLFEKELPVQLLSGTGTGEANMVSKCAKLSCRFGLESLLASLQIDFIWPYVCNVYGPGETSARLVNTAIRTLLRGESPKFTAGTQYYTFIYIDDLARAYALLGDLGRPGRNYMLAGERPRPLKEFLTELGAIVAPGVPLLFGAAPFSGISLPKETFDNAVLIEDTGFAPKVSFQEGIALTAGWIKRREA